MSTEEWKHLAVSVSKAPPAEIDILRERGTDVRIARTRTAENRSVIVKCWNRKGPRGFIRRLTRTNIGRREFEALRRLWRTGTPCPEPLAYVHLSGTDARHTEALVSGDLGECSDSTEVYKNLFATDPQATAEFEQELIRSTMSMVRQGLLDTDHRLPNYVVPPGGTPMRIDFELCRPVTFPFLHPDQLGVMLGTFLGSMVFAVQPDVSRAEAVAKKLFNELTPSPRVVRTAQKTLDDMMKRQAEEIGIQSELDLEKFR